MAFYFLVTGLISLLFSFLAAPSLRVLRQQVNSWFYWSFLLLWVTLLFSPITFMLGLLLSKLWLVVGIYAELEFKSYLKPYTNIAVSSVLASAIVVVLGFILAPLIGAPIGEQLNTSLEPMLKSSLGKLLPVSPIKLIPSIVFFLSLSNIVFAIALDRRFAAFLNLPLSIPARHPRFLDFKAPDFLIWPFLISILGTFLRGLPEVILIPSLNLALALASIYCFQGMSVIENLLSVIRAGLLVRILVYVLLVGQMFFLLLSIGLVDYWVDIRGQFTRRFKK
jgi:hypothetical protein